MISIASGQWVRHIIKNWRIVDIRKTPSNYALGEKKLI